MDKPTLRSYLMKKRTSLDANSILSVSNRIAIRCVQILRENGYKNIHIYTTNHGLHEVDTAEVLRCIQEDNNIVASTSGNTTRALMPTEQFDCVIVPVLGFDQECHRIGMGLGWYDAFLSTQAHAFTVGLAFDLSLCDVIPTEAHDKRLDMVITESKSIQAV